jgi:TusA-related sulfurtransferase
MLLYGIFKPLGRAWMGMRHRLAHASTMKQEQVDLPGRGTIWVDKSLNFVGDNCLRTNLLTKLVLDKAVAGTVFEISSDNLSAVETIPFMLPNCNCEHLATIHEPTCRKIYVRKRETRTPPTERECLPYGRQR